MQQRYYDPIAGRFLSVDPIVTDANTGAGFGLYTYVDNNPYAKIDPDGREAVECPNAKCPTSTTNGSSANKIDPVDWNSVARQSIDIAASIAWGLAPGSGAVDCWRHGCSGWEYGLAAIDLMPGAGKVLAASFKVAIVLKATRAAKGENLIYRAASGTPASMTPRAVDAKGLSAADSLANALPGKNQVIDTSKFKSLCAVCDNPTTGHVSITPKDMSQMQGWINSRGGAEIHPLTRELMDAVVGTVKK